MRVLKFRICYTAQNGEKRLIYEDPRLMIGLDGQVYENYGDVETPLWEVPFDVAEPPVVQLFTGVHDKNKKEIWEGDKVKYQNRTGIVEFFAGKFQLDWGDQTDDDIAYLMIDDMEVIGNIFGV